MKKLILFSSIVFILLSFKSGSNYEPNNSTAEVEKIQGLYIYFASKPVSENEYLGTIKVKWTSNSDSDTRLNAAIKKCKSDFPEADAIVFPYIDFQRADAIKFKK